MPLASELLIVGLSHHTAPVEVREQLALSNGRLQELGPELAAQSSIHEVVALSTCNRVEIVAYCEDGGDACGLIRKRLIGCSAIGTTPGSDWIFELRDRDSWRRQNRLFTAMPSTLSGP
jgi:glutamyl-tRNA reductase